MDEGRINRCYECIDGTPGGCKLTQEERYKRYGLGKCQRPKPDTLTASELEVLGKIRTVGYGEVTVKIRDGKPVLVEERKTTRLD